MSETDKELEDLPGVGPATADTLRNAGYNSVSSIAMAHPEQLADEIGDSTAEKAVKKSRELVNVGGFTSGKEILESETHRITTGVDELDDILGGGVKVGEITEFHGENSSGKSQVAHQLAVNSQLDEKYGGVSGRSVYVDSEDTYSADRIEQMVRGLDDEIIEHEMDRRGIDGSADNEDDVYELVKDFAEKIHVSKAFNSAHQRQLVEDAHAVAEEFKDTEFPVKLMVVDSIIVHFRGEYVGRGELANRQQLLNQHITEIDQFIDRHDAAVMVANQVQSDPDAFFGDPTKPAGGNIVGHKMTVRVYLRPGKKDTRVAEIKDAPDLPDKEAPFLITEGGLVSS